MVRFFFSKNLKEKKEKKGRTSRRRRFFLSRSAAINRSRLFFESSFENETIPSAFLLGSTPPLPIKRQLTEEKDVMHHGGARERLHAREPQRDAVGQRHARAEVLLVLDRLCRGEGDIERAHSGRGPPCGWVEGRWRRTRGVVVVGRGSRRCRCLGGGKGKAASRSCCCDDGDADDDDERERAFSSQRHQRRRRRRRPGAAALPRGHDRPCVSRERG